MKKSTILSMIALLVAVAGAVVALMAFFKRRKCVLCDDFDDDSLREISMLDCDCGCEDDFDSEESCGCHCDADDDDYTEEDNSANA